MPGPGHVALTQRHPQDKEAGMQVTQCGWEPASWGSTAYKLLLCLAVPIGGPQTILSSAGQDAETWRCSWGHQRNHFRSRDPPERGHQVAVIMTSMCPFIRFPARSLRIIYHCAAEKACEARQLVCSRWVSAPTKQKLMNDSWEERQGIGQQLF